MKDQTDVTSATTIGDYNTRRTFVYRTLVNHANISQADLRSTLARFNIQAKPYYLVNGIQVDADWLFQFLFSMRGDVDRVLPAPVLRPLPGKQASPVMAPRPNPILHNGTSPLLARIGSGKSWELPAKGFWSGSRTRAWKGRIPN